MEAWEAEKQRYQLAELAPGILAYSLKPEAQGTEPAHAICATCYENRQKSILQSDTKLGHHALECHRCGATLWIDRPPPNVVW